MNGNIISTWQRNVLVATATPMAAIGIAGGIASFYNFREILASDNFALSVVLAGEGATLVCALVILCLTLLGQHSPKAARAGLWLLPITGSVSGALLATDPRTAIVMAVSPLAMTVAGEGTALVARRVVAYQSGTDLEANRRNGRLLWHSNRAANGGWAGRKMSRVAVWRLTRQMAETDAQLGVQLNEILRYQITESAADRLGTVLNGKAEQTPKALAAPARPETPALPVREPGAALVYDEGAALLRQDSVARVANALNVPSEIVDPNQDNHWDFVSEVLAEAEAHVAADPSLKLLTTAEVAELKGVSPGTVRSWVNRKQLPVAERSPKGNLFSPVDVARMD